MAEPLVLAIDTATVVAVGLARGEQVVSGAVVEDRMAHVERLVPLIHSVCTEAGVTLGDLDQIVVGLGPGPFTGLRVGVVTARMLAEVGRVGLHGVCTLDVLAVQFASQRPVAVGDFVVATDARRREVYWARYAGDGTRLEGPSVSAPAQVPRQPTVGPGADLYPEALECVPGPRTLDPAVLAVAGPGLPSAGREPLYLRRPDASEPGRRKPVLRPTSLGPTSLGPASLSPSDSRPARGEPT
jgi:tRNA threonylcarbamoyl adenosine modification protein YeaZ